SRNQDANFRCDHLPEPERGRARVFDRKFDGLRLARAASSSDSQISPKCQAWQTRLFVPTIASLKTARALALDDDLAMLRAQFDLANVSPRAVNFLGDQSGALP